MKTNIFPLFFLIVIMQLLNNKLIFAQKFTSEDYVKNHIFLELGGNGYFYSINYERLITKNFSLRGGFGYVPEFNMGLGTPGGNYYSVPVTASYLIGSSHSKFELGLGATFFAIEDASILGINLGDFSGLVFSSIVGYRGSSRDGGFVFRIAFTPFFSTSSSFEVYFFGGVSFGYAF